MKRVIRLLKAFDVVICMTLIIFSLFICYIYSAIGYVSLVPHSHLNECIENESYIITNIADEKSFMSELIEYRKGINEKDYSKAISVLDRWIDKTNIPANGQHIFRPTRSLRSNLIVQKYFLLIFTHPYRGDYIVELNRLGISSGELFDNLCYIHSLQHGYMSPKPNKGYSIIANLIEAI